MTETPDRRPVVVGFDGSDPSRAALSWALRDARRRHLPVHVLVAKSVLYTAAAPGLGVTGPWPDDLSGDLQAEARRRAHEEAPDVPLSTESALGSPAAFLVRASAQADLVVVGRGRHSMLGEAVVGSTSTQVAAHAACPVVVVQQEDAPDPAAPIVVGTDGSLTSEGALAFALDRASLLGTRVRVVHAWWLDVPDRLGVSWLSEDVVARVEAGHRALLDDVVATWSAKYPDVDVVGTLVRGLPVEAIAQVEAKPQLVVVGSRGHGGFAGLLLGSVSQGLLHRDRACPLVVVHERHADPQG